jgi:hypothetical protein
VDFQNWKNDLLGTGLSIAHLQGIYACLHALLNYAVKYDFLVKNHLSKLGNFKNPNAAIKEYNVWDVSDFEKFAEEVKKTCIEYEEKKNEVLASYDFLEATKISKDGECYQSAPAKFEYGGYDFCTYANLTVGYYTDCACKSFGFIGTDDDKNRIAYCYFYDFDLDTFGSVNRSEQEMITDFINDFFDWNDLP